MHLTKLEQQWKVIHFFCLKMIFIGLTPTELFDDLSLSDTDLRTQISTISNNEDDQS